MLVTLSVIFLSIFVESEWDEIRLTNSVNFSTGVTVPVLFHSKEWLKNAAIVFVVIGGTVLLS